MGRFDALTNLEESSDTKASLLANQQTSKEEKKQTSKPTSEQTSVPANQQTSTQVNQQTSKPVSLPNKTQSLSTKEKRKYGTYLREDSIADIQVHAIRTQRKDHEVLQEAVDFYFKNLKK